MACRNALGLNREKTLLTLGEFYAPSPDVASRATGRFPLYNILLFEAFTKYYKHLYKYRFHSHSNLNVLRGIDTNYLHFIMCGSITWDRAKVGNN